VRRGLLKTVYEANAGKHGAGRRGETRERISVSRLHLFSVFF
jgi:hypothetical protein